MSNRKRLLLAAIAGWQAIPWTAAPNLPSGRYWLEVRGAGADA